MENLTSEEHFTIHDRSNMDSLLKGGQIEMLRQFSRIRNVEEISNIGTIYYLFTEYWPHETISILRKRGEKSSRGGVDAKIIEENNPLRYISDEGCVRWRKISKSIKILDSIRKEVLKNKNIGKV